MDSMRSLNTSLPTASPRRRRQRSQPPEHLLASFKAAALSVTNLYKAAASEHDTTYNAGYQDALEDLLSFLDKENLGLQDGEGWRVRQWATERFEGGSGQAGSGTGDSEDEAEEENTAKATRESSPTLRRKTSQDLAVPAVAALRREEKRAESAPPIAAVPTSTVESATTSTSRTSSNTPMPIQTYTVPSSDFTFSSGHSYPHDMDMDAAENGTVHVNLVPRSTRHNRQGVRGLTRTGSNVSLGHGAGMKRRMPNFDFFDLGGFNKDNFGGQGGGGKRGRFT